MVLEKTPESPLDNKEIQPVHPKGNQSWIFIGRTDVEAETPILWPPDAKNWLTGKDPDAGKDWRQEEKGTTEEMVGWHYWFNGRVWASSRSWWWTGRPGVQQSMRLQRVRPDWATEQQSPLTELYPWTRYTASLKLIIFNSKTENSVSLLYTVAPRVKSDTVCKISVNIQVC